MQDPAWEVIVAAKDARVMKLRAEDPGGKDAFETLRDLHKRQGKVEELESFFERLDRGALDT